MSRSKKEKIMKTTSLIALSVLTTLSFTAPIFGQVKGGEKLAGVRPVINTTVPSSAMSCPTETRSVSAPSARGSFKKVSVYTAHLCPSCKNTEVTSGAGKLATRVVKHSCQAATVCCNVKN